MTRAAVLFAIVVLGCGGDRSDSGTPGEGPDAVADTSAAGDTTAVVVALHPLDLRLHPAADAPGVRSVGAAEALRVIETRADWLRVATWDDRAGWLRRAEALEMPEWVRWQEALGGVTLAELRPAYPLADGRWAVEARPPSGMLVGSPVWVDADPPAPGEVAAFEPVAGACQSHRMAIVAGLRPGDAGGRAAARDPRPVRARLAVIEAPQHALRRLDGVAVDLAPGDSLIAAYAAGEGNEPALLVVRRGVDERIDLEVVAGAGRRLLYTGYGWGC